VSLTYQNSLRLDQTGREDFSPQEYAELAEGREDVFTAEYAELAERKPRRIHHRGHREHRDFSPHGTQRSQRKSMFKINFCLFLSVFSVSSVVNF
jgi:hypothetical protein